MEPRARELTELLMDALGATLQVPETFPAESAPREAAWRAVEPAIQQLYFALNALPDLPPDDSEAQAACAIRTVGELLEQAEHRIERALACLGRTDLPYRLKPGLADRCLTALATLRGAKQQAGEWSPE